MTVHFNKSPGIGGIGRAPAGGFNPRVADLEKFRNSVFVPSEGTNQDSDSSSGNVPTPELPPMIPHFGNGGSDSTASNANSSDNSGSADSSQSSDNSQSSGDSSGQVKTADQIQQEAQNGDTQQAQADVKAALAQNPNDSNLQALSDQLNQPGSQLNALG